MEVLKERPELSNHSSRVLKEEVSIGMPAVARFTLVLYAGLMLGGGVGGYRAAGSKMSLWAGMISFILLVAARGLAHHHPRLGFGLGLIVALSLTAVFAKRVKDTGKAMPSGMLCALSVVVAAIMGGALG